MYSLQIPTNIKTMLWELQCIKVDVLSLDLFNFKKKS